MENDPQKAVSEKEFTDAELIEDVIEGKFEKFDPASVADYDADFSGSEPYFINIWSKRKGMGYVVFHDFLRRVGIGNSFVASDFTGPGLHLFEKASAAGAIRQVSEKSGFDRRTRWEVLGDPISNLEKILQAQPRQAS